LRGFALSIVLSAALLHAGWNYLAKKSRCKIVFLWLSLGVSLIFYFPMLISCYRAMTISPRGWICIFTSGLFHAFYFWCLGNAYEHGDLSLVYPLARGFGPLLVPLLAFWFIHEQLYFLGMLGIAFILFGIYTIHLKTFSNRALIEPFLLFRGRASIWALCTGVTIAGYSIVDKIGVSLVSPPVYIYLMILISWLSLAPYFILTKRRWFKEEWKINKGKMLVVGFLDIFTYLMILFALQVSKVSYVVAVREVSIVFSSLFGIIRLGDRHGAQRLSGALIIAVGVFLIGLSR